MAKKHKGKGDVSKANAYKSENRAQKNAIRRLERHLKSYPNDEQGVKRLEEIKKERPYTRNRVKTSHSWKPEDIKYAELNASIGRKATHTMRFDSKSRNEVSPSKIHELLARLMAERIDERLSRKG